MAKLLLLLFLILPTHQTIINYVNEMNLESSNGVFTINKDSNSDFVRFKRDTAETSTKSPSTTPPSKKGLPSSIDSSIGKIIPKVNYLNDSHAQLMVHWLGEGTNVMICLAREPPLGPLEDPKIAPKPAPSAVFISTDYGDTFTDRTDSFKVLVNGTEINSTLDQFMTHPKYNTIVFTDPRHKAIFISRDNGIEFKRYMLDFHPSDISFYEQNAKTFLVLDKEDPERKLYFTKDFGETFNLLQPFVKSFLWSTSDGMPTHLYIERQEPSDTSHVIYMNAADLMKPKQQINKLIENVEDFHIKKDFMFASRKVLNNTQLWISYKRGSFCKADFQTELDIKGLHIADVEGKRIMVSAVHTESITHLYVSEGNENMSDVKFIPSLENIFTYIPNLTWKQSWLVQTSDEPFTDLYKVEGFRGIYIASKIQRLPSWSGLKSLGTIGPEHLVSIITFDHGASWKSITAPTVDDEGQLINCTKDCSLHLSQKFSQLYPVTRSVSIMSSKLAPGVIMASGVIGKSLKGHPCVFISRDAGVTWKQILKNYHFFNFGDHGGILVAVKYFKSKGETQEILYSTDEGDTWIKYPFHSEDLKVYGLMTEPNTNTSIFTLFGSEPSVHKWLIVKVDLKNAFTSNCTTNDYKNWAPGSQSHDTRLCVMGKQDVYQRRLPHANCYNGPDYVRLISSKICECTSDDFECDYGFSRLNKNSPCERNKTIENYDPYKIPESCKIGQTYIRTKGYRKIDGDECVGGFFQQYDYQKIACPFEKTGEFLVVAQRDKISRIDLGTGQKEVFPVTGLRNVIAIDFDMKHNCVFWADILTDTIGRQCLDGNQTMEILVETELASVEGMSYDWISQLLYFVDGTRNKIEAVKTSKNSMGRLRRTIIDSKYLSKPRGVVVHPVEGYLFWTDWSSNKPSLSRSNLDGTDVRILFTKPEVVWPNGVSIDYIAERVYWVDASKDYIASCDLHGKSFKKILESDPRVSHPFAVAVYKDSMYWDDWKMNSVFSSDKDQGIMIHVIAEDMPSLMDLKIYAHSIQEGSNPCLNENKCSHICVGAPKNGYTCLCPDGMEKSLHSDECLCPGGLKSYSNKTCPQLANTCATNYFTCANKLCIPNQYRCDDENDCGDNSDEKGCSMSKQPCPPHMFTCRSDRNCIPQYFRCDHDKDCMDGSDEEDCPSYHCDSSSDFTCKNGRCVSIKWMCDGEDDCRDGSDEANCSQKNTTNSNTCKTGEFNCESNGQCIPSQWRCDSDQDCPDGTDEKNCQNNKCDSWMFSCGDGHCIYNTWKCDGESDCDNGADEKNCTTTTTPIPAVTKSPTNNNLPSDSCHDWMFKCANQKCVPYWWKCDSVNDCGDNSDEFGCANTTVQTTTIRPKTPTIEKCSSNQFKCNSGICISRRYVCDGYADCARGEDEESCPPDSKKGCGQGKFRCRSDGLCLPMEKYCDKILNCVDGSDEEDCQKHPNNKPDAPVICKIGFFTCDNTCTPLTKLCDGKVDCYDGSDETNCNTTNRIYQVTNIGADERSVNETSFTIFWWIPVPQNIVFEFLPSISLAGTQIWTNHTSWINGTEHRFNNLSPFTTYNFTVYVRVKGVSYIYPPYLYENITTSDGVPTEPLNVNVTQVNGSRVQVSWQQPKQLYGTLVAYAVYYRRESMLISSESIKVSPQEHSVVIESDFQGNSTYEFWVKAKNLKNFSPSSKRVRLEFDGTANIDSLTGLKITERKPNSITIIWNSIKGAEGYVVQPLLPQPYPRVEPIKTIAPTATITNMVRGAQYVIKVSAFVKSYFGAPSTQLITLPGEALPEVSDVKTFHNPEFVNLRWKEVKTNSNANILYGVYYGTSMDELYEIPRIKTEALSVNISNLRPCESYIFGVGVIGPVGPGPLGRRLTTIETKYNEKKAPKNLDIVIDNVKQDMTITWEHTCPLSGISPAYVITIRELVLNKTSRVVLKPSDNKTLSHVFTGIPQGAEYEVHVAVNSLLAEPAVLVVHAKPLPSPRQLVVWPENNGTHVVYWKVVDGVQDSNFTYQLVVYNGINGNKSEIPIVMMESNLPPILVNPDQLGGKEAAGQIFTIGVRVKTSQGFVSPFVEFEHIELQPDAWMSAVLPSSSSAWLFIVPTIIVIALVVVVLYLVQRHKRLQNSFSRFANSHYDTKTGATRIGDALDDDEHDQQPRFADDEPLVIA